VVVIFKVLVVEGGSEDGGGEQVMVLVIKDGAERVWITSTSLAN
jgi:hypothetical protein